MEVQILSICPSASVHDVKHAIADVLHVPDFQQDGSPPINFEVFFYPAKSEELCRTGVLTLPSHDIGEQFLQSYGGSPADMTISVGWYDLEFRKSNKEPRPAILKKITTTPYVDPKDEEEHKQLEADLRTRSVSVCAVQFGWECRDSVYSVEYEKSCEGSSKLTFDGARREFRVRVTDAETNSSVIIVIRAMQIAWAAVHGQSPTQTVLFLALHWSPTYEFEQADEPEPSDSRTRPRKPPRQCLTALDPEHAIYSIYTSLALRFVCDEENALDSLLWLCKHARVKRNKHIYPVAQPKRNLFAPNLQNDYRDWLASLKWELAFQVDTLARNNIMDLQEILSLRSQLCRMAADKDAKYLASFVRHLAREARDPSWYRGAANPKDALKELFIRCRKEFTPPRDTPSPDDIANGTRPEFECFHAIVTPSTVRLEGPFLEQCNRVIRKYARNTSCFLRVRFADEARLQFRSEREVDCRAFIHNRFGNVLRRGLVIAGRHFHFLGYTQASLKEHTAWFVRSFKQPAVTSDGTSCEETVTADTIIAGLGVFDGILYDPELIMCPARYGARQAQCFSSTSASVTIDLDDIEVVEDIVDADGERSFTDGVGTISPNLAAEIWTRLCAASGRPPSERGPRRFQIRIQGAKGMVSVDHLLQGRKLCLRPSMIKFYAADSRTLEIADAFVKPSKFYLNRPLVMLLEELDILGGYDFLKFLQESVVEKTEAAVQSLYAAADLFDDFNLGRTYDLSNVFRELHHMGIATLDDTFSQQVLCFGRHHVLRDLKYRARIPVPSGWNLVGVADIHGCLEEGEIFACVIPYEGQEPIYLHGPTLISRSPVIHRGDVQVVRAIGPPPPGSPFEIEPLHNSVVFSTKGSSAFTICVRS
ncbi:uncharacterized protein PHACADRAFT_173707 [Phanerochaete carnosa HHB-10118-sp]|uniref:RNA-dependent RNA polymerase n=1 Tax=Phanerochaete carnosa (strain HHB-10118-sp) TaxID=650164 RepID=K5W8N3_PHACS|nr:uncharacterized protein PHACADRAFT_173707 [Phanerochaete carnosa HHB-10118-sp]EKM55560.1 hypothetical protein PHACADRAFT_173707 [Phanerochaete carnosa HHB-10118-sp]